MNYRVVVSAVIKKGDCVLFGRKPPGVGPFPDTWHLPGGGVELGEETCEEAIKREVLEETGLCVKNLEKLEWETGIEKNKHGEETYYIFLVFYAEYESGELTPMADLEKLEWVEINKIPELIQARFSKPMFERLGLNS